MSKMVYIDIDPYNRKYVREIIPDECRPIKDWYNQEFADHCIEAPDDVEQNMLYDDKTGEFTDWMPPEDLNDIQKSNEERLSDLEEVLKALIE